MTVVVGALLIVVGIQAAAIAALLVQRARRARAERILRESEAHFRLVADHVPAMIWTARPDTTLDYLNRGLVEFMGLPYEKVRGNGWMDAVHPEDLNPALHVYYSAVETRAAFTAEYRTRRADGIYRWLLDSGVPKYGSDGRYTGYIGCVIDITERKESEDRIRDSRTVLEVRNREIQQVAGRLIAAQDTERARIARDLHDDVSQQLAGLSIALSNFTRRVDEDHAREELQADLRALHRRANTLAQNVRNLSHDLHPTVLRHGGLVPALTTYCAELERTHRTTMTCTAEGDFASLAPDVALCLYRVAQEALRNVVAHAGASRADVRLLRTSDRAEVTIADDGKGFDLERALERGKGLGLVSIRERARLAGGTLTVLVESKQGTRVSAQIPAPSLADGALGPGAPAEAERREISLP